MQAQGLPGIQTEFKASLGNLVRQGLTRHKETRGHNSAVLMYLQEGLDSNPMTKGETKGTICISNEIFAILFLLGRKNLKSNML